MQRVARVESFHSLEQERFRLDTVGLLIFGLPQTNNGY